jgi:hypothetical protein
MLRFLAVCILASVAAILAVDPVSAQDAATPVVTLAPADPAGLPVGDIIGTGIELLGALVLAGLFWVLRHGLAFLKLSNDAKIREYLDAALYGGIGYAVEQARLKTKDITVPAVRSELAASAIHFVNKQVPGAVAHFGLDDDALLRMVQSRLGLAEVTPSTPEEGAR